MEYQVPQFIEVEDKIVGPLTLKQFIYLAGGAGLCALFFFTLPLIFAIILGVPIGSFAVALAFYRMNGKPFIEIIEAGFAYYTSAKFFLWRHAEPTAKQQVESAAAAARAAEPPVVRGAPRLTRGKLSELAWSLDVKKDGTSQS